MKLLDNVALQNQLNEKIYEAALFPARWSGVLEELNAHADGVGAVLFSVDLNRADDEPRYIATPGLEAGVSDLFNSDWRHKNTRPIRAIMRDDPSFMRSRELFTESEWETDEFRLDFLHGHGLDEEMGTAIVAPDGRAVVLTTLRAIGKPMMEADLVDAFTMMRPHIARSVTLATRVGLQQSEMTAQIFEALGCPAAIVDRSGSVVAANSLFPLDGAYFTTGLEDRLIPVDIRSAEVLDGLTKSGFTGAVRPRSFPIFGQGENPPLIAHLLPMAGDARDLFNRAHSILVLTQLSTPTPPAVSILRGLFDLTSVEAQLARSLASGASLDDLAKEFNRGPDFVRRQLSAVFDKTGTKQESQLVSLLLGGRLQID